MRIYLAGIENNWKDVKPWLPSLPNRIYVLSSYFYARTEKTFPDIFPYCEDFLLDSGAFTFIKSQTKHLNWDEYLEQYADYIKRLGIKKYLELDIDAVVGYEKVKEYRAKLERIIGLPCIPVWHRSRGQEEFFRLCDEYDTIALGGIAVKHIRPTEYKYFPWLIAEAHKRKCQIHGLGLTNFQVIRKCHFDSVDSTTWVAARRYGIIYKFDGKRIYKIPKPAGSRARQGVLEFSFMEWVKFQQYALTHL